MIRSIFQEHKRRYGARRIMHELAARGERCSRRRVRGIMDEMILVAIQAKSFKQRTTDSRHTLGYSDNLLLDARAPVRTNQHWPDAAERGFACFQAAEGCSGVCWFDPLLLLGDLNTTPFSYHFRRLAKGSGLTDSARGYGPADMDINLPGQAPTRC